MSARKKVFTVLKGALLGGLVTFSLIAGLLICLVTMGIPYAMAPVSRGTLQLKIWSFLIGVSTSPYSLGDWLAILISGTVIGAIAAHKRRLSEVAEVTE